MRDFWGIPVARLSGTDHPHNLEISRFLADRAEQWLLEAGATRVLRRQKNAVWLSAGQHQSGTCRMSVLRVSPIYLPLPLRHEVLSPGPGSGMASVQPWNRNRIGTLVADKWD